MKVLSLHGGLGNAMFQYAVYLQLKKQYPEEEIMIDSIWYDYTYYPYEMNRLFNLKLDQIDLHKRLEEKYHISFEEELDKLRFWKWEGYETFHDMGRDLNQNMFQDELKKRRLEVRSTLRFEELVEPYRNYIPDLEYVCNNKTSIQEMVDSANGVKGDYQTTKTRTRIKSFWKSSDSVSYQIVRALSNPDRRKKLVNDILHLHRPDYCGYPSTGRLQREGNIYYFIYGNPNDCEGVREELLKAFTFPEADENTGQYIYKIQKKESVAVYTRTVSYTYGMEEAMERSFYQRAIAYIRKKRGKDLVFFVFPDDPEWAHAHLEALGLTEHDDVVFVDISYMGDEAYRKMQLGTLCNHVVAPRSTFAWWAGYLNDHPDKIFITPYATLSGTISF